MALAFFDLDGFKTYNDMFGHTQGDLLLARLGELARRRHPDVRAQATRSILDQPGSLTQQEWQFIHQHRLIGQRILASAPALARVVRLVRSTPLLS